VKTAAELASNLGGGVLGGEGGDRRTSSLKREGGGDQEDVEGIRLRPWMRPISRMEGRLTSAGGWRIVLPMRHRRHKEGQRKDSIQIQDTADSQKREQYPRAAQAARYRFKRDTLAI